LLARVQRNWNHRDRSNGHRLFQVGNRLCQQAPQNCRCGTNLLELEQMNQVAQSSVIATVRNRPFVWRIHALTEQAPRLPVNRLFAIRLSAINADWDV